MEEVSTDYKDNSKKFRSYIKSKGQEWIGFYVPEKWSLYFTTKVKHKEVADE
jgi:hypothetical protein